jgi:acyl dehydratase
VPRLTDEIRAMIGLKTSLQRCCDVVEPGAVRRYAQAIMDLDPIYADPDIAATTRYGAPVAPPLFPTAMLRLGFDEPDPLQARASDPDFDGAVASATYGLPPLPLPDSPFVNGGVEVEFYRYPRHGEEVFVQAAYEDIVERETSKGWMLFVHYDCQFLDAQQKLLLRYRRVQVRK